MDKKLSEWMATLEKLACVNRIINAKFASVDNHEERSKLIANSLIDYSLHDVEKYPHESKNVRESKEFRELGNAAFNCHLPKLQEALQFYSKSILYAPPGTNELSLGYANRSAVLMKGGYYAECLDDIDRALTNGYPDDLKPKLLLRKIRCLYALRAKSNVERDEILAEAQSLVVKLPATNKTRQLVEDTINNPEKITATVRRVERIPPKYALEVKGENAQLPGASDAIALKYRKEYGKHIVATRDIKSGEVLTVEKPYAAVVVGETILYICTHCSKRTWNSIPCDNCVHAMFCSEECKQAAWSEYHDIECPIRGPLGYNGSELLALRIAAKAIKEAGTLKNLEKRLKELDSLKDCDITIPINPNSYETFYTMNDNCEHKKPDELLYYKYHSTRIAYLLATRTELFGRKFVQDSKVVRNSKWFPFVTRFINKTLMIGEGRASQRPVGAVLKKEDDFIVTILLPIFSFFNNRCYGDVGVVLLDGKMSLIAPFPIKKDDQIFVNYGCKFYDMSRKLRMEFYQSQFHFTCNCLACKENWSASTVTSFKAQNLPLKIAVELRVRMQRVGALDIRGVRDPEELIKYKTQICELMDLMYPHVSEPCAEVEILMQLIVDVHNIFGSSYPEFSKECQHSCDGFVLCPHDSLMRTISTLTSASRPTLHFRQ